VPAVGAGAGSRARAHLGPANSRTSRSGTAEITVTSNNTCRIVWVTGGMLASLGGILWAYYRPGVTFDMGSQILLLIFAGVTLGGLGTVWGALIGSIIVGIFVELTTVFGLAADLKYVGALFIMIIVLLIRPQGILGRRERVG